MEISLTKHTLPSTPPSTLTACRWVFLAVLLKTLKEVRAQAWDESALWALTLGT